MLNNIGGDFGPETHLERSKFEPSRVPVTYLCMQPFSDESKILKDFGIWHAITRYYVNEGDNKYRTCRR